MKSFNKIVALLLLAVSFSAGAVTTEEAAKAYFAAATQDKLVEAQLLLQAAKDEKTGNFCKVLERVTGISGTLFCDKAKDSDPMNLTAQDVVDVINENTGVLFQAKRVLDSNLTKLLGGAAVLGGTIYVGNKYKTQLGDVSKKLGTKIADGSKSLYNKVNGPKAVAFVTNFVSKGKNWLASFKKQAVKAVPTATVTQQPTYAKYDGAMNTFNG